MVTAYTGLVNYDQVRAQQDALRQDERFNSEFDHLIDMMEIEKLELTAQEARQLARQTVFSCKSRLALVAVNPCAYGICRMVEIYSEAAGLGAVQSFHDVGFALAWLGIPEI